MFASPQTIFYIHMGKEMKWYYTLVGSQMIFYNSHIWKKWYCTFVHPQVIFLFTQLKKNHVAHMWACKLIFCTHSSEFKKLYCTVISPTWFFYSNRWRKNDIAHLWACKRFLHSHFKIKEMILHIYEPANMVIIDPIWTNLVLWAILSCGVALTVIAQA
jgi:hypothetical protein